ncbi:MAG: hypothetical protein H7836_16425, partial [Magnetococcus sp. YQC-3]
DRDGPQTPAIILPKHGIRVVCNGMGSPPWRVQGGALGFCSCLSKKAKAGFALASSACAAGDLTVVMNWSSRQDNALCYCTSDLELELPVNSALSTQ